MIPRRIRLVANGASQSPAAFAKMSADVIVPFPAPVTFGSQVEQSRIPSSSTVLHCFGGRFQLNTKANHTIAATAFTPSVNYKDMPALVSYASDDARGHVIAYYIILFLRTEPSSPEGNDQPVSRPWNLLRLARPERYFTVKRSPLRSMTGELVSASMGRIGRPN